jgi:hypothetical protein
MMQADNRSDEYPVVRIPDNTSLRDFGEELVNEQ